MKQCEGCASTETVSFTVETGETQHWCKECVGDGIPYCGICGMIDSMSSNGDVDFCAECFSFECGEMIEWEDEPCNT